jgi:hypothetical protein
VIHNVNSDSGHRLSAGHFKTIIEQFQNMTKGKTLEHKVESVEQEWQQDSVREYCKGEGRNN